MRAYSWLVLAVMTAGATACGSVSLAPGAEPAPTEDAETVARRIEAQRRDSIADLVARTRESVPLAPSAEPTTSRGRSVYRAAMRTRGMRILVSTEQRALWLMRDTAVVFRAPVAVGMEQGFTYGGRKYDFNTPLGQRKVLAKDTLPVWTPPDWHYYEIALERKLRVVHLRAGRPVRLADGSLIEIRQRDVGRINEHGNFWPFTPGTEIIFDSTIYVPPLGTRQRQVGEVLGTHKLSMGDGYLIHGTDQETSIGGAVSHGCVRMYNADVAQLYVSVPVGTPVYIF